MGIIGEDGTYTNLGLLLSDECVHTIKLAENAFKITLPNRNFIGKGNEIVPAVLTKAMDKARRQDIIYYLAQKQGSVTRKDVENILQMSQSMAILILREMVDKGVLVKDGEGKQLQYHISEN